jgi:hypothetical protein
MRLKSQHEKNPQTRRVDGPAVAIALGSKVCWWAASSSELRLDHARGSRYLNGRTAGSGFA